MPQRLSLATVALSAILLVAACGNSPSPARTAGSVPTLSGVGASAVPGQHAYTTHDAVIAVKDGPDGQHSANIDTRLYLPDNATPATPQPAVLMTNGFGLSKTAAEITAMGDFLARHGYIVLTFSAQGFGASSGCIRLDSVDYDVKDASQLIDKVLADPAYKADGIAVASLVARDALGPKVGMIGGSYGGGLTVNAAATDARVRTVIPGRTWNSLQYALYPNNLVTAGDATGFNHQLLSSGVFKLEWTSLFFASGNAQPAQGNGGCPQEKATSGDLTTVAGVACTGYALELCETYAKIATTGDADDASVSLLKQSSAATHIAKVKVPVMLVQGQSDTLFNLNDAAATYLSLRQADVPVALIWNSGGHGGYDSADGECEVYGGGTTGLDGCYLSLRQLAWFDRWLRGDTTVDTGPGFAYYRDWVAYDNSGSAYSQYGQAAQFPAQAMQIFYLSGSDALVTDPTTITTASTRFINPSGGTPSSYTETSNFTGPASSPSLASLTPVDPPGETVSFTSAPFTRDVVSAGIPSAHLHLAHINTQDLVFFGKVWDVDGSGNATLIHRLIAPVRVADADLAKAVDIHLLGFAHRFAKGHSVRLTLAATDQTSYNAKLPDSITVTTGGSDPASFSLPVDGLF